MSNARNSRGICTYVWNLCQSQVCEDFVIDSRDIGTSDTIIDSINCTRIISDSSVVSINCGVSSCESCELSTINIRSQVSKLIGNHDRCCVGWIMFTSVLSIDKLVIITCDELSVPANSISDIWGLVLKTSTSSELGIIVSIMVQPIPWVTSLACPCKIRQFLSPLDSSSSSGWKYVVRVLNTFVYRSKSHVVILEIILLSSTKTLIFSFGRQGLVQTIITFLTKEIFIPFIRESCNSIGNVTFDRTILSFVLGGGDTNPGNLLIGLITSHGQSIPWITGSTFLSSIIKGQTIGWVGYTHISVIT